MNFPQFDGTISERAGMGTQRGTTITASASTHTKGNYTQLIASTTYHSKRILVFIAPHATNTLYLTDIAVGANGAEQVIIPNLPIGIGTGGDTFRGAIYDLPVNIPAGTRVSARVQSQTTVEFVYLSILLLSTSWGALAPRGRVTTYGADISDTTGLQYDPGGSANTKGGYLEVTSSTSFHHSGLLVVIGNQNNAARTTADWKLDIAIGAGGAEKIIFADLWLGASATEDTMFPFCFPMLPVNIPEGSRLSVNASCSTTDATDRLFDIFLIGVG